MRNLRIGHGIKEFPLILKANQSHTTKCHQTNGLLFTCTEDVCEHEHFQIIKHIQCVNIKHIQQSLAYP